jgi:hypothetical protein
MIPCFKALAAALREGDPTVASFRLHNNLLCYQPKGAKARCYAVPALLRPMLLKYFHDSPMSGNLGAFKNGKTLGVNFTGRNSGMFSIVVVCVICQRPMSAQDARVGSHTATPASYPLDGFHLFHGTRSAYQKTKSGDFGSNGQFF